jgi:hypothetical protein
LAAAAAAAFPPCEQANNNAGGGVGSPPTPFVLIMTPPALQVTASVDVTFANCSFRQLGGSALGIFNGSTGCGVSGSAFSDLSGGAVFLGNVNETQSATDGSLPLVGAFVEDSTFESVGVQFQGAVPITLFAGIGVSIAHNALAGPLPYSGVSFGWPVPQNETYSANNTLANNYVEGACSVGTDGGSVHTIGPMPGAVIAENVLANDSHGHAALYIDNTSADFVCLDNVIDNSHFWFWIQQSRGHNVPPGNNHAYGSFVRNSSDSQFPYNNTNCSVGGTTYLAASDPWPAAAEAIIARSGPRPLALRRKLD